MVTEKVLILVFLTPNYLGIPYKDDLTALSRGKISKTRDFIRYELREYASPKSKLAQMIKKGEVIQIVRGVYSTAKDDP